MGMAGREVAPSIQDRDHGLAHDVFTPKTLLLHSLAMRKPSHASVVKPAAATQLIQRFQGFHVLESRFVSANIGIVSLCFSAVIVINPIQTSKSSKSYSRSRGHGRATLADVAAQAGVTTMTVSRFLRSPQQVAQATALKITQALQETGYSPNLQAGSLASGRSRAVAVIVPNIAHSIFADTLHGLGLGLQKLGLHMIVSSTGYSLEQEAQQVRTMLGWAPAALVLTGRQHLPQTQHMLALAAERGTPIVEMWDQSPAGEAHAFAQIGFDHHHAGALMAQALIARGCKQLAFMDSAVEEDFRAHERAQGFIAEAKTQGLMAQLLRANAGDPVEQGGLCFAAWYAQQTSLRRCGIGFANDLLATGALLLVQLLKASQRSNITLLGFGDFPVGRYCQGGLNTMQIDGERIGQACAEHIGERLRMSSDTAFSSSQMVIEPRLLWRSL
jgi:LacI family transcriptional regulator, gluconate utilization system Gnt-I transcriptional repressor